VLPGEFRPLLAPFVGSAVTHGNQRITRNGTFQSAAKRTAWSSRSWLPGCAPVAQVLAISFNLDFVASLINFGGIGVLLWITRFFRQPLTINMGDH
jgi:hypothetical protein